MKTLTITLLAASFGLIATVPAYAGHGHSYDRLYDRMERQQERIEHGIDSRELTRKEAKILKKQQRRIRRLAREFREDGWLSKRERRILRRKLDRASEQIRELKHNDLNRYVKWHDGYGEYCDHTRDYPEVKTAKTRRHRNTQSW